MIVNSLGTWRTDGTDCTATLQAALTLAGSAFSADKVCSIRPVGGAVTVSFILNTGIAIPDGVTLEGGGSSTILKCNAATFNSVGNWSLLQPGNNCIVKNLVIDGNQGAISAIVGAVGNIAIYVSGKSNVRLEGIEVHDLYNNTGESFGILVGGGSTNVTFDTCWAHNINGSGLHVAGTATINTSAPFVSGWITTGIRVINCRAESCIWNGITVFFAQDVEVIGGHYLNNMKRNCNVEWSDDVQFTAGMISAGAQWSGVGTYGPCTNIVLNGITVKNNVQAGFAQLGEIDFSAGTSGIHTAQLVSARVINCTVIPGGGSHVSTGERSGNITLGPDAAGSILVEGPDVETWTYTVNNAPFDNRNFPWGIHLRGLELAGGIATGHPSTWGTQTNTTWSAPPSGALSTNTAKTLTQTAANTTTIATSATSITKGGRYFTPVREYSGDAFAQWKTYVNGMGSYLLLPNGATDVGQWFATDMLTTIPPNFADNNLNIAPTTNGTAGHPSSIGVDFIAPNRMPYLGSESGS